MQIFLSYNGESTYVRSIGPYEHLIPISLGQNANVLIIPFLFLKVTYTVSPSLSFFFRPYTLTPYRPVTLPPSLTHPRTNRPSCTQPYSRSYPNPDSRTPQRALRTLDSTGFLSKVHPKFRRSSKSDGGDLGAARDQPPRPLISRSIPPGQKRNRSSRNHLFRK